MRHDRDRRRRGRFRRWWAERVITIRARWTNAMPKFFKVLFGVFSFIGGMALAVNTALQASGAQTHQWWNDLFPYLIGTSAGAAFVAKFTAQKRGNIPGFEDEEKEQDNTVLDKDDF